MIEQLLIFIVQAACICIGIRCMWRAVFPKKK